MNELSIEHIAFFKENGRWYYANDTFVEVVPRPAELPDVLFLEKAAWSEEGLRPAEEARCHDGDAFTIQILQGHPHWQFDAVALRQLTGQEGKLLAAAVRQIQKGKDWHDYLEEPELRHVGRLLYLCSSWRLVKWWEENAPGAGSEAIEAELCED